MYAKEVSTGGDDVISRPCILYARTLLCPILLSTAVTSVIASQGQGKAVASRKHKNGEAERDSLISRSEKQVGITRKPWSAYDQSRQAS